MNNKNTKLSISNLGSILGGMSFSSSGQITDVDSVAQISYDTQSQIITVFQEGQVPTGQIKFGQIFKFIKFQCPCISGNVSYKIKIQLSQNADFNNYGGQDIIIDSNPTAASGLISSAVGNYYIFNQNKWNQYSNLTLRSSESLKIIQVDIQEYLNNNILTCPYYGRISFINEITGIQQKWTGFSLSFVNIKTDSYEDSNSKYQSIFISGSQYFYDESYTPFYLIGKIRDSAQYGYQYQNLTDDASFGCYISGSLSSVCNFLSQPSGNILHVGKSLDDDTIVISAVCLIEDQIKQFYYQSYIKANKLLNYYIDCNNLVSAGTKHELFIRGNYSDGSTKDLTDQSIINVIPSGLGQCIRIDDGQEIYYILSANTQIQHNELGFIDAKYPVENPIYEAQKQVQFQKSPQYYLDLQFLSGQTSVSGNQFYGVIANLTNECKEVKFNTILKDKGNSLFYQDVSSDITIDEIGSDYLEINNSQNIIKLNDNTYSNLQKYTKVLIDIYYQNVNIHQKYQIMITPIPNQEKKSKQFDEVSLQFIGPNVIKKNQTIQYVAFGLKKISDQQIEKIDITPSCNFELITPNNQAILIEDYRLISGTNFDYSSYGALKLELPVPESKSVITKYANILFEGQPITIKYLNRQDGPGWLNPTIQNFQDNTVIIYPSGSMTTNYGNMINKRFVNLNTNFALTSGQYAESGNVASYGKMYLIEDDLSSFLLSTYFNNEYYSTSAIVYNVSGDLNRYQAVNFDFYVSGSAAPSGSGYKYSPYVLDLSGNVIGDIRQSRSLWKFQTLLPKKQQLYKSTQGFEGAPGIWSGYSINEAGQHGIYKDGQFISGKIDSLFCGEHSYKINQNIQINLINYFDVKVSNDRISGNVSGIISGSINDFISGVITGYIDGNIYGEIKCLSNESISGTFSGALRKSSDSEIISQILGNLSKDNIQYVVGGYLSGLVDYDNASRTSC